MNRIRFSKLLYVGLLLMLTACQAAGPALSAALLRPGGAIDGMSLTTGAKDAAPLWAFCSPAQYVGNSTISDCNVPLVPKLAIGNILMPGDDALSRLDWSQISWELAIDDQPIDLKSFGTYDFALPAMSHNPSPVKEVFMHFTAWDVALMNLVPGQHTLRALAHMGTESYAWVMNLTIEGPSADAETHWVGIQKIS